MNYDNEEVVIVAKSYYSQDVGMVSELVITIPLLSMRQKYKMYAFVIQ